MEAEVEVEAEVEGEVEVEVEFSTPELQIFHQELQYV